MFRSIFVRCGTGHHPVVFLAPLGSDCDLLLCTCRYLETCFRGSSNDRNEYAVKSKQCVKCKHAFPPRDVGATKLRASAPVQSRAQVQRWFLTYSLETKCRIHTEWRRLQAQSFAFVSARFPFLNWPPQCVVWDLIRGYLHILMSSDGFRFKKHMSNRK